MILERIPEILRLTKAEQAELCGELVDLLAEGDGWQELSPEIIAELDRRMEEYRRDPGSGRTWEQVKARIAAGDWRQWQK
jgi:putative addiction module component (TIGR02574 family)